MEGAVNQSLSQFHQRITALEDLLRRNEGSVSHILSRLKNAEVAVNGVHRSVTDAFPKELRAVSEDVVASRKRVEGMEGRLRPLVADAIAHHDADIKARMGTAEERYLRTVAEAQNQMSIHLKREMDEANNAVRKLTDVVSLEARDARQTAQGLKAAHDQLKDLQRRQQEATVHADKRLDGMQHAITVTRQELADLIAGAVERSAAQLREEIRAVAAAEQGLRGQVDDIGASLVRLRDDTIRGLSQAATNMRGLDETTQSLEAILRAEAKGRITKHDDMAERIGYIEQAVQRQTSESENRLRSLDDEVGRAIMDVHRTTQAEAKTELDRAWRNINELKEQLQRLQHTQRAAAIAAAANTGSSQGDLSPTPSEAEPRTIIDTSMQEVQQKRLRLQWQADLASLKEEVLASFDADMNKARQSVLLLMEQQEDTATALAALEGRQSRHGRRSSQGSSGQPAQAASPSKAALAEYSKLDDLQEMERRIGADVKTLRRELANAKLAMEEHAEALPHALRSAVLKELQQQQKTEQDRAPSSRDRADAAAPAPHPQVIEDLQTGLRDLNKKLGLALSDVDDRLNEVEEQSQVLQALQKRLEQAWSTDQEALEGCVGRLRDELQVLAAEQGVEDIDARVEALRKERDEGRTPTGTGQRKPRPDEAALEQVQRNTANIAELLLWRKAFEAAGAGQKARQATPPAGTPAVPPNPRTDPTRANPATPAEDPAAEDPLNSTRDIGTAARSPSPPPAAEAKAPKKLPPPAPPAAEMKSPRNGDKDNSKDGRKPPPPPPADLPPVAPGSATPKKDPTPRGSGTPRGGKGPAATTAEGWSESPRAKGSHDSTAAGWAKPR